MGNSRSHTMRSNLAQKLFICGITNKWSEHAENRTLNMELNCNTLSSRRAYLLPILWKMWTFIFSLYLWRWWGWWSRAHEIKCLVLNGAFRFSLEFCCSQAAQPINIMTNIKWLLTFLENSRMTFILPKIWWKIINKIIISSSSFLCCAVGEWWNVHHQFVSKCPNGVASITILQFI